MRIISGTHRARRIEAPANLPVRPTTDMAKESLFNILNNLVELDEIKVLDLFSGTGNIAYEFASRKALEVIAVDENSQCCQFISKTASQLKFDQLHVIQSDVFRFLEKNTQGFDLIFADPPYQMTDIDKIVDYVFKYNCLNESGLLIVEHSKNTRLSHLSNFMQLRNYGSVHFSFFVLPEKK